MSLPIHESALALQSASLSAPSPDFVGVDILMVCDAYGRYRPAGPEEVLRHARQVMAVRVQRGAELSSPDVVKDYLRLKIGTLEHEVFCVLFLDTHHRVIELREMFRGTLA